MFTAKASIARRSILALVVLAVLFALGAPAQARAPGDVIRPPVEVEPPQAKIPDRVKAPEDIKLPQRFVRGDSDGSGAVELSDAIATLSSLFLGTKTLQCKDAADANDDGELGISDAIHTLGFLFLGGVTMPSPFPGCGEDATQDALGCESSNACQGAVGSEAFRVTPVEDGYLVDLPAQMVSAMPEVVDMGLRVEGRSKSTTTLGVMQKLTANTIHVQTTGRMALEAGRSQILRLTVPAKSVRLPGLGFDCGLFACTCSGDDDCNDLFSGTDCGGDAVCIVDSSGGVWCICSRW